MIYYQVIESPPSGSWHLDTLVDAQGTSLDPRQFCNGVSLFQESQLFLKDGAGKTVLPKFPISLRIARTGTPLEFTFASFGMPVVSSRLAKKLLDFGRYDLELLPVSVNSKNDDYYIVNFCRKIDCIDHRESEMDLYQESDGRNDRLGLPKIIYRLRVDPSRIFNTSFFRVATWEVALVVSEDAKLFFSKEKVVGLLYERV